MDRKDQDFEVDKEKRSRGNRGSGRSKGEPYERQKQRNSNNNRDKKSKISRQSSSNLENELSQIEPALAEIKDNGDIHIKVTKQKSLESVNSTNQDLEIDFITISMNMEKLYSIVLANRHNLFTILQAEYLNLDDIYSKINNTSIEKDNIKIILDKLADERYIQVQIEDNISKYKISEANKAYFVANYLQYSEMENNFKNLSIDYTPKIIEYNIEKLIDYFNFGKYNSVLNLDNKNYSLLSKKLKKSFTFLEIDIDNNLYTDLLKNNLKSSYDIILAPFYFENYKNIDKQIMIQKCFDALNDNGMLVMIEDLLIDNSKNSNKFNSFMKQYNRYNLSHDDYTEYLVEIGFMNIETKKLSNCYDFIFARKKN